MQCDEALAMGLPIATGVIEGACRYLVKDRMDRGGARWTYRTLCPISAAEPTTTLAIGQVAVEIRRSIGAGPIQDGD